MIERFLMMSGRFSNLTLNEIIHAFYLNAAGEYADIYKHYNRWLDAEFIGNVLISYCKYKDAFYKRVDVKGLLTPPAPKPKPIAPTTEEVKAMIQQDYNFYLQDAPAFIFLSKLKYKLLRQISFIEITSKANWHDMYTRAFYARRAFANGTTTDKHEREERRRVKYIYDQWEKDYMIPLGEHRVLVHNVRKGLYLQMFMACKACGIVDIFKEVKR